MPGKSKSAEPQSLLHYSIIETLGTGGNGTVYRAQNTKDGSMVAIKTLKNVSEVALNRFKREFFALKKMDDPGIVKVYDGFFDHHPPFFSMEWVKGKTLSDMITDLENNPMVFSVADRENFAVRMAVQVCDILTYIHSFDEVHRDLKPDNIFITQSGGNILSDFTVKMLDFGLLKQVNDAEASDEDTDGGMIVGTVHYLSPEQAKGTQLDLRSDLFSLGIIMYKIICLKLPYEASDVVGYIFKTVFEDPAPIESHTDEVSKKMAALLGDLLSKEPGKRPPSAAVLKRRLKNQLEPAEPSFQLDIEAADLDFSGGLEGFGSPLLPPPLTGREGAIKKLETMLEYLGSNPVAAVLEGEPGMGRSSMIKEWKTRVKFANPVFLQAHFPEEIIPTQDPLGMLVDSLVRSLKPEEVRDLFREVYPFLSSVSRYLGRYFDTKSVGKFDHLSPGRKLQVLAVNFIKLLQKASTRGPVVIILDDVQNAPERFFGWLTLFWEQVAHVPVLLIFSCSLDPSKGAFNQFRNRLLDGPDNIELPLKPLDSEQTVQLLQSMLPIGTELPFSKKLVKLLMERANGNPYYAIELFSALYEEEQVFINKGTLDVRNAEGLDVPLSIHQALLKKINRLPDETRLMLRAAAVLGHTFDYQWLVSSLRWSDEQLMNHLNTLIRLSILSEEEQPVHKLYFNAPALQKIIYDQIDAKEKAFLHNNTAKSIEGLLAPDDVMGLEQVAQHYAKGANHVRAVKYAYLAGNSALEAKDTDRAIYFYELSLSMMDKTSNVQARNLVSLKLAEVHLTNEKPAKALEYYNASLKSTNLSKMEKLRTLRGRMMCHEKLSQLPGAFQDAQALCDLGASCSKRIQAETRLARGYYGWLSKGMAGDYMRDVFKANLAYNKLPHWPVRTAFTQLLANEPVEANKRLTELVKKEYQPRFPVFLLLGFIRYFQGSFKKAKSMLAKARDGEDGHTLDPHWMVAHSLLTYKVQASIAPDHPVDEYLSIARRYIERFGLQRMGIKITLARLEHYLLTGQYEEAWNLTSELVRKSPDLPLEFFDRQLFLILTVRSAWEVQERPPRGWLLKFQRYKPDEDAPFLLQTHYAMAKAAEASLPLSMAGPDALKALKATQKLLIKLKLKYYYRATLLKEINLLRGLGQVDQVGKLEQLRQQIDATIDINLPTA